MTLSSNVWPLKTPNGFPEKGPLVLLQWHQHSAETSPGLDDEPQPRGPGWNWWKTETTNQGPVKQHLPSKQKHKLSFEEPHNLIYTETWQHVFMYYHIRYDKHHLSSYSALDEYWRFNKPILRINPPWHLIGELVGTRPRGGVTVTGRGGGFFQFIPWNKECAPENERLKLFGAKGLFSELLLLVLGKGI